LLFCTWWILLIYQVVCSKIDGFRDYQVSEVDWVVKGQKNMGSLSRPTIADVHLFGELLIKAARIAPISRNLTWPGERDLALAFTAGKIGS
jgi:hypothetical protein